MNTTDWVLLFTVCLAGWAYAYPCVDRARYRLADRVADRLGVEREKR